MLLPNLGILVILISHCGCGLILVNEDGSTITSPYQEGLVLYNGGTVCDDLFSDNTGTAICREIGFTELVSWRSGDIWTSRQNLYSIKLDDVICISSFWSSCSYLTSNDCSHSEDVFLSCSSNCTVGQYINSGSCVTCPADSYSASRRATSCTPCPSNSTSSPGSSRCNCPAGRYWEGSNCAGCSSGTYKSVGMESCVSCPVGSTSEEGSGHCSCPAGKYWNEGTCHHCPGGSSSPAGVLQCMQCPAASRPLQDGASCSCPAGKIWAWTNTTRLTGSCLSCNNSSTSPKEPSKCKNCSSCSLCPSGTGSEAGAEFCVCPAGDYWNGADCQTCPPNSVSQEGALECVECPDETSSDVTRTSCVCLEGPIWGWEQDSGSCVSPQDLTSWHSRKIFAILLLAGLLAMAVSIIALGMLLLREKRKRRKEVSALITAYHTKKGEVNFIPDRVEKGVGEVVSNQDITGCSTDVKEEAFYADAFEEEIYETMDD